MLVNQLLASSSNYTDTRTLRIRTERGGGHGKKEKVPKDEMKDSIQRFITTLLPIGIIMSEYSVRDKIYLRECKTCLQTYILFLLTSYNIWNN